MTRIVVLTLIVMLAACSEPAPARPLTQPATAVTESLRSADPSLLASTTGDSQLLVTHASHYRTSTGAVVVQGVIENRSALAVGPVEIAVSLLSDSGATITTGQALHKPTLLRAGARAPWSAIMRNVPAFKDVRVQAQARPLDDLIAQFVYQDLRSDGVTTVPAAPPFNLPKISGQIVNTGSKTAALVNVLVAVYAADGQLVAVDTTTAKLSEIAPGQSAPFEFTFLTANDVMKGKAIERFELYMQGLPRG